MPRRSRKNRNVAEFIASLLEPAGFVKEWYTDRDGLDLPAERRADLDDAPCHLVVDDGRDADVLLVTVQKIPRPADHPNT